MNTKERENQIGPELEEFRAKSDFVSDYAGVLMRPQIRKSLWSDPQAAKSLERATESMASAYLTANLNFRDIPLKEFMDGFEKKILLACLSLTRGHQKDAAAVLGLKPTALFEKMRKHCINGRRKKLSAKLEVMQPQALE
jgi:DNA-binding NtrC family response regulator